jgi:hypothetical protein
VKNLWVSRESFGGSGWAGILRGLGAAPLALRVSRFADRPALRLVSHGVVLLFVSWPAAGCSRAARAPRHAFRRVSVLAVVVFLVLGCAALRVRAARGPFRFLFASRLVLLYGSLAAARPCPWCLRCAEAASSPASPSDGSSSWIIMLISGLRPGPVGCRRWFLVSPLVSPAAGRSRFVFRLAVRAEPLCVLPGGCAPCFSWPLRWPSCFSVRSFAQQWSGADVDLFASGGFAPGRWSLLRCLVLRAVSPAAGRKRCVARGAWLKVSLRSGALRSNGPGQTGICLRLAAPPFRGRNDSESGNGVDNGAPRCWPSA